MNNDKIKKLKSRIEIWEYVMQKQKWVVGNWKMNGRADFAQALLDELSALTISDHTQVGVAPPLPYLALGAQILRHSRILAGAQDVSSFAQDGAFTGEASATMLKDIGADFVLIGHSERRQYFGEDNEIFIKKIQNALQAGLRPIYCVGENLQQRESKQENQVISDQLNILDHVDAEKVLIAYEPVWAIGTGKVATEEQIMDMHQHIYQHLLSKQINTDNITVLYGGSVNADNALTILNLPRVDGALVGGASLKIAQFRHIIKVIEN